LGILTRLSEKQEDLKSFIVDLEKDDSFEGGVTSSLLRGQPIEEVVNVAIIYSEMEGEDAPDYYGQVGWASEFLDHLDTIGWTIRPKNKRQRREVPAVQEVPGGAEGG
jgi:hypothetical protein